MATVLRVKRRNSDQPQDALILCKRPKLANDGDDEAACSDLVPTVAKFAGTLKDPEENVLQHLAKTLNKEEIETNFKKPPHVNFLAQRRKQTKENSAANRYKVVNCHRSLDTSKVGEFEDKVMTFIDVEDSTSLTTNQSTAAISEGEKKNSDYVYDLYYVENYDSADDVWIHPYNEHELVYEMSTEDDLQSEHDSEDSNAESYYRNTYPTSESDNSSFNEDDMRLTIQNFEECNLCSEDEDYEDYGDREDEPYPLDMKDVEMHGYKYAKYKQRMKALLDDNIDIKADDQNTDSSSSSSDSNEKIYPWNSNGNLIHNICNSRNA